MLTVRFQKSKVGATPSFALNMPDAPLLLAAIAEKPDMATWLIDGALRRINDGTGKAGIKLYDESGSIWTTEKALAIFAQGMTVSNSTTLNAEDFAAEWAGGLAEITAALVPAEKIEAAKAILAQSVRHGGKGQLSEAQAAAIIRVYGSATNESEIIALAVANAKARKAEIDSQSDVLMGL